MSALPMRGIPAKPESDQPLVFLTAVSINHEGAGKYIGSIELTWSMGPTAEDFTETLVFALSKAGQAEASDALDRYRDKLVRGEWMVPPK